jgi:hypothetical protein
MNVKLGMSMVVAVVLVSSVLALYTFYPRTITITVTAQHTSTTTVFDEETVGMVNATGRQALLCTATQFVVGDITINGSALTTQSWSTIYASATNVTNSIGYVTTTTSPPNPNDFPSAVWTVTACTYLP